MKILLTAALTSFIFSVSICVLVSIGTLARAETVSEHLHNQASEADSNLSASAVEIPTNPARNIDELWIGLDGESYLDRAHPPAGIRDYTFLSGRLRTRSQGHVINGAIDVGGAFATSIENYTFFEMPEAYLNWITASTIHWSKDPNSDWTSTSDEFEISVGRRREPWSTLDEDWGFGLWQPVNRFDAIHPTEQGLAGVFGSFNTSDVRVTAFVSPVFIPEQGATYEVSNGNFTSNNPWFSKPPRSVELFPGRPVSRLNFDIHTPSIGSVINHWSEGVLVELGSRKRSNVGAFLRAAFIRKPRNSIFTPFETTYVLADTESYGNVVIYPRVEFQKLESLEFGYRTQTYAVGFSALRDDPEKTGAPEDSTGDSTRMSYETLTPAMYFSPYIEWRAFPRESWGPRLRLMGLTTVGGETQAQGLLGSSTSLFGYRTPYRRGVSLQEDSMLWRRGHWRLDQTLRLIQETEENGSVLMADARLSYTASWRFALAADILGSGKPDIDTGTFLARYRGNDNVSAHITYIY